MRVPSAEDDHRHLITGGNDGGGTTCTAPTTASITYAARRLHGGRTCRTTETITFTAKRGVNSLQTCDSVELDVQRQYDQHPAQSVKSSGRRRVPTPCRRTSRTRRARRRPRRRPSPSPPRRRATAPPRPTVGNFAITFTVPGGCSNLNGNPCNAGESISFDNAVYYYTTGSVRSLRVGFRRRLDEGAHAPRRTRYAVRQPFRRYSR